MKTDYQKKTSRNTAHLLVKIKQKNQSNRKNQTTSLIGDNALKTQIFFTHLLVGVKALLAPRQSPCLHEAGVPSRQEIVGRERWDCSV